VQLEGSRADALHKLSGLELSLGLAASSQREAEANLEDLRAEHANIQDVHAQASNQVSSSFLLCEVGKRAWNVHQHGMGESQT